MTCNCLNLDDDTPCRIHNPKLERPPVVEHSCLVVKVYRRSCNKQWFYTITRDAVQVYVSQDLDTRPEIEKQLTKSGGCLKL